MEASEVKGPPHPWPGLHLRGTPSKSSGSSALSLHSLKYVEPLYDAFVCPLTKQVMRDPVSLENGQTFERAAIEKWLKEECAEKGRAPICPVTGAELSSTLVRPSHALRNTIEEWTARTEAAQIDNAKHTLSSSISSIPLLLSALHDLTSLCVNNNRNNKRRVRIAGVIPLISAQLLSAEDHVRSTALSTLRVLCQDDDDCKEAVGGTDVIRNCFKCLSYKFSKSKQDAIHLLAELSKHPLLRDRIAAVNGSILMLVGLSSSTSEEVFIVEKAEETLTHLEDDIENVKQMAENGRLQPLLRYLVHGEEEESLEMTRYLADVALSKEGKLLVAETAGQTLVQMLDSEALATKEAALKCLAKVSSSNENGRVLTEAGVLQPIVRDLFLVGPSSQLPMKVKEVSATILANIVNSAGVLAMDLASSSSFSVEQLTSEDVIHNLLHMISNTGPALEGKLLQVMVGIASSSRCVKELVRSILSAGATGSLIQFMEAPQAEIRLNCVKLLNLISPYMGQILADALRATTGQLGVLLRLLNSGSGVSEEQAAAASLLANLPYSDLALTRALLKEGALAMVSQRVQELYQGLVVGGGRYVNDFKVSLVAILCRFTFLLEDVEVRTFAQDKDMASLFTELLRLGELEDIKQLAAVALHNLSNVSKSLSLVVAQVETQPDCRCFGCWFQPSNSSSISNNNNNRCGVHGGVCTAKDSFCLVESGAVLLLGSILDHKNVQVVEACLGALATLIDPALGVNSHAGIAILNKAGIISAVLDIMKDHRTDVLWWRSVWMVERFLDSPDMAHVLALDPGVHSGLIEAYRHGNVRTKQMAERALKQLNKIPSYSIYVR